MRWLLRLILTCFGLVLILCASLLLFLRQQPAQSDRIAFSAGNPPFGGVHLYLLDTDNGDLEQLTTVYTLFPQWIENGRWFAFITADFSTKDWEIYTIRPDGSQLRNRSPQLNYHYNNRASSNSQNLAWSPDGETLIFTYENGERLDLYRTTLTEGKWQQLTFIDHNFNYQPSWSPTGEWLAFVALEFEEGQTVNSHIYLLHPDGSGLKLLASFEAQIGRIMWSPDGGQILAPIFISNQFSTGWEVQRIQIPNGQTKSVLQPDLLGTSIVSFNSEIDWSPDSQWLAFMSEGQNALYKMRPNGGQLQQLATVPVFGESLAWSPDGEWLAFTSSWKLYRVRPDGTDLQLLYELPARHNYYSLQWQPLVDFPYRSLPLLLIGCLCLFITRRPVLKWQV